MDPKKLYKDKNRKMIGGVCAGISDYFNIDVSIIRLIAAALSLFYGAGVLLYIIAVIILPDKKDVIKEILDKKEEDDEGPVDMKD